MELERPLQRLSCGCLVRCEVKGNVWIEHKLCKVEKGRCKINEYIKEHKVCLVCGSCLKCFDHKNCNKGRKIPEKILTWVYVMIIGIIVKILSIFKKI